MNQTALYAAIKEAQFSIEEFVAPPGCFGSWYVIVHRENKLFRIAYDGRDSFLRLELKIKASGWENITYAVSETMSNEEKIMQIQSWLFDIAQKS